MNSGIRDWNYRHYVANSLRAIPRSQYYEKTLYELMHPEPEDTRTGDEIAADVIGNAGLKWKE